jgi:hypothetical protein
MTVITNPHAPSSTSAPMGDRLTSALPTRLRLLVTLVGVLLSAPVRRFATHDVPRLGANPPTSAAPPPLESP